MIRENGIVVEYKSLQEGESLLHEFSKTYIINPYRWRLGR